MDFDNYVIVKWADFVDWVCCPFAFILKKCDIDYYVKATIEKAKNLWYKHDFVDEWDGNLYIDFFKKDYISRTMIQNICIYKPI